MKLVVAGMLVLLSQRASATTILYLNSCAPDGCVVTPGATDARTDASDLVTRVHQLAPWRYGPAPWNAVVSCVRSVMSPFDVEVTDVDPGTADHLEVMIAGTPQQLGVDPTIGGLADLRCAGVGACSPSVPDALAFVFADVWNGNAIETCASAAQQIGHTWALDHVIDARDPMSVIRAGAGVPAFRDGQVCGSDCVAGFSQFGLACSGTGVTATHACIGTGQATQDEVATILSVVGPSRTSPPTLALLAPLAGAVTPGFAIDVACTSSDASAAAGVDITVDGDVIGHVDAAPYELAAPPDLAVGAHTITATCTTAAGTASISTTVSLGAACVVDRDCPEATDVCDAGACIPGSDADGGLGTACKTSDDCASEICASEGWGRTYCVVSCTTDTSSCPVGFACFAAAGQAGACWAVESGGCDASGGLSSPWWLLILLSVRRSRRCPGPAEPPR